VLLFDRIDGVLRIPPQQREHRPVDQAPHALRSGEAERPELVHVVLLKQVGKWVLLQVVEAWLYQATAEGLPPGVAELRDELLADDELKNT
jgi:hypothetical protein